MSPIKEPPDSLSPVESGSLVEAHQSRGVPKLLFESPRRRRIDESVRVAFLSTLPKEEGNGTRASWREKPWRLGCV